MSGKPMQSAETIITRATKMPHCAVVALLSGGHDSATCTHVAKTILGGRLDFVAHINTGIGIEETRKYVRDFVHRYGLAYREYKATENTNAKGAADPQIYEDLVVSHGFPGPSGHQMMYARLKERPLRVLQREVGATTKNPVIFITGVRKEESSRRMRNVDEIQDEGRVIWCAPLTNWTKRDCQKYMADNEIPENPVANKLCMSGECLCGAFARGEEERAELRALFPEVEAEISRIEGRVIAAGFPWKWHEAPPKWWTDMKRAEKAGQPEWFEGERDDVLLERGFMPLCTSCNKRADDSPDPLPPPRGVLP